MTCALASAASQPFGAGLPLASTPHANRSEAAGYDGLGERLRHVFDALFAELGDLAFAQGFCLVEAEIGEHRIF